jgi:hypothetical protein
MVKFTSSVEPNRFFTDRSNLKDEYLSPYTNYMFQNYLKNIQHRYNEHLIHPCLFTMLFHFRMSLKQFFFFFFFSCTVCKGEFTSVDIVGNGSKRPLSLCAVGPINMKIKKHPP